MPDIEREEACEGQLWCVKKTAIAFLPGYREIYILATTETGAWVRPASRKNAAGKERHITTQTLHGRYDLMDSV